MSAPVYTTPLGACYQGDALALLPRVCAPGSVDLVVTSPPYPLLHKKAYGNVAESGYVAWFLPFARAIHRALAPHGSLVLNLGTVWLRGQPTQSLYAERLLLALCDELGFHLAQRCYWHNPARMPAPAEWVNVRRVRVKDAVEQLLWLAPSAHPRASNARVLRPYSADMRRLIARGMAPRQRRPSGHLAKAAMATDRGGSIPDNVLTAGNNESNSAYVRGAKAAGAKVHPARFPAAIPRFFIELLTEPGALVVDPFAGSNTTGAVAEQLGRRWVAIELDPAYAADSRRRFAPAPDPSPSPQPESHTDV